MCLRIATACLFAGLLGLTLSGNSAIAVVVAGTLDSVTTSRAADDFGWSNVGVLRGSTGVYLGDGWVLTAAHVGVGPITFPELGTYQPDTTSGFLPANSPGMTPQADLLMFRLLEKPALPPLAIGWKQPPAGAAVWVAGNGKDREESLTEWDVRDTGSSWTWSPVSANGNYSGYKTINSSTLRWGTNLLEDDERLRAESDEDIGFKLNTVAGETLVIYSEFDRIGSKSDQSIKGPDGRPDTPYESQAVLNDSGGPMFYKRPDGRWELAGITIAVEGHRNQPDVTRTAVFGDFTYYADLSAYSQQIATRTRFGDFDNDLELTANDLALMVKAIEATKPNLAFDLDRDGRITEIDHRVWVEQAFNTYLGDSNLDGQFSSADMVLTFQAGQYDDQIRGNATWTTGDWNADREFTSRDFVAAFQSGGYEQGTRPTSASRTVAASVPEPCGFSLLVASLSFLLMTRHRNHRNI